MICRSSAWKDLEEECFRCGKISCGPMNVQKQKEGHCGCGEAGKRAYGKVGRWTQAS